MNWRRRRVWSSLTLASYLLAMVIAVPQHHHAHGHSSAGVSSCANRSITRHCHHDAADPHDHQPKDNHPHDPAQHDDCLICQYLSNEPLSPPTVAMVESVELVTLVEPLSLDQSSEVYLAGFDCRGPPSIG